MSSAQIVVTNMEEFRKLQRAIIDVQRARKEAIAQGMKADQLDKLIPEIAKAAGVDSAGLQLLRANANLEAEAFASARKLAAQKAVATRKARNPGAATAAAAKAGGAQVITTGAGIVVMARPSGAVAMHVPPTVRPAPTPAPEQPSLLEVPAAKAEAGKKGDGAKKSAYQARLFSELEELKGELLERLAEVGAKAPTKQKRKYTRRKK